MKEEEAAEVKDQQMVDVKEDSLDQEDVKVESVKEENTAEEVQEKGYGLVGVGGVVQGGRGGGSDERQHEPLPGAVVPPPVLDVEHLPPALHDEPPLPPAADPAEEGSAEPAPEPRETANGPAAGIAEGPDEFQREIDEMMG